MAAAASALAAMSILIPSYFMPFLASTTLARRTSYTLVEGIEALYDADHYFIGTLILVFSVLFPIVKIGLLLAATLALWPLAPATRARCAKLAVLTGKYSLLDVLVVAILVVVVKMEGLVKIDPEQGTILFGIAIVLSMVSGLLADFKHMAEPTSDSQIDDTSVQTAATAGQPGRWRAVGWALANLVLAIVIGVIGITLWQRSIPPSVVSAVNVTRAAGSFVGDVLPSNDEKDFYVKIQTRTGDEIELDVRKNTPIGNGLKWTLPNPTKLIDMAEITLWDSDMIKDDQLDRVTVAGSAHLTGQRYQFDLDLVPYESSRMPWVLMAAGAVYGLGWLLILLRRLVV